jgi:hypothetical protein
MATKEGANAPTHLGKVASPTFVGAGPLPITDIIRSLLYPEGHLPSEARACAGDCHVVTTADFAEQILGHFAELEAAHITLLSQMAGVRGGRDILVAMLAETQAEVDTLEAEVDGLKAQARPLTHRVNGRRPSAVVQ